MRYRFFRLDGNTRHCGGDCRARRLDTDHGDLGSAPAVSGTADNTVGEPDLHGIWTATYDTPFQRPPHYATRIFHRGPAVRTDTSELRSTARRDPRSAAPFDFARAYNHAVILVHKHVGARTSLLAIPPLARIPRLTLGAQKTAAATGNSVSPCCKATETCKGEVGALQRWE